MNNIIDRACYWITNIFKGLQWLWFMWACVSPFALLLSVALFGCDSDVVTAIGLSCLLLYLGLNIFLVPILLIANVCEWISWRAIQWKEKRKSL